MENLINKTFNLLTPITKTHAKPDRYDCVCSCGKNKNVSANSLKYNHVKSCGCLRINSPTCFKQNDQNKRFKKYSEQESSIIRIWKIIYNQEIPLDQFKILIKQNCSFCDIPPSLKYTSWKNSKDPLYYNGLDRINQSLPHTIDNVVTCCKTCNYLKCNLNYNEFITWINNFNFKNINLRKIPELLPLPNKLGRIRSIKNKTYAEMELQLFYTLSQQNCYYCNSKPSNNTRGFIYNGIDRIDSSQDHNINNIVSCCKHCNFSKKNLDVNIWYDQILKIKMARSLSLAIIKI